MENTLELVTVEIGNKDILELERLKTLQHENLQKLMTVSTDTLLPS